MSDGKSCYQRFLEQLAVQPDQLEAALHKSEDVYKRQGLEKLSLEEATQLQKTVKSVFNGASEPVSLQNLANVAGGIDCAWGCGPLQCC